MAVRQPSRTFSNNTSLFYPTPVTPAYPRRGIGTGSVLLGIGAELGSIDDDFNGLSME